MYKARKLREANKAYVKDYLTDTWCQSAGLFAIWDHFNKLNSCILIVLTYDQLEDKPIDDIMNIFLFNSCKANRFHVAMCLFTNTSQKTLNQWHIWQALCATFLFLPHLTSSVIKY